MNEREFQGWVIDVFTRHGWTVKHAPTPMRPVRGGKFVPDRRGRGLLDLHMTHPDPPRLVLAECKAADGELSDAQIENMRALRKVAAVVRMLWDDYDGWPTDKPDRPPSPPFAVYLFAPGSEALIEAIARGADIPTGGAV